MRTFACLATLLVLAASASAAGSATQIDPANDVTVQLGGAPTPPLCSVPSADLLAVQVIAKCLPPALVQDWFAWAWMPNGESVGISLTRDLSVSATQFRVCVIVNDATGVGSTCNMIAPPFSGGQWSRSLPLVGTAGSLSYDLRGLTITTIGSMAYHQFSSTIHGFDQVSSATSVPL